MNVIKICLDYNQKIKRELEDYRINYGEIAPGIYAWENPDARNYPKNKNERKEVRRRRRNSIKITLLSTDTVQEVTKKLEEKWRKNAKKN
jgi:hypothetical protein